MDHKQHKQIKNDWDTHWKKVNHKTSIFGKILELDRKYLIAYSVAHYFEKYFPQTGTFVEMGSGTSQTSIRIKKHSRKLIALDISKLALIEAKKIPQIDQTIHSNIFHSSLKDNSIDGIWNLGVMEHFTEKDIVKMLNEFHRVMKKDSYALLLWPPVYGSSELILGFIEYFVNIFRRIRKKELMHFFPGEITRLQSNKHAKHIISKSKLKFVRTHFNIRDGLTYVCVVCKKE